MAIAFHCANNTFLRIVNFNIKYIFRFDSGLCPTSKEFNWHRSQVSGAFSHSLGALFDLKNLIAFFEQKKKKGKLSSLLLIYFPGTTEFKVELRVDKTFLKRFLKAQDQRWELSYSETSVLRCNNRGYFSILSIQFLSIIGTICGVLHHGYILFPSPFKSGWLNNWFTRNPQVQILTINK